jgi:hypothetical protein
LTPIIEFDTVVWHTRPAMKPNRNQTYSIQPILTKIRRNHRSSSLAALLLMALSLLIVSAARAIDVEYLELFKGEAFTQTGASSPVPAVSGPYLFQTFV